VTGEPSRFTKALADYRNPRSVGSRLRARRLAHFTPLVDTVFREKGSVRILDIGGTPTYWRLVSPEYLATRRAEITLVNLAGVLHGADLGGFRVVEGDACDLVMFTDGAFDLVHSNSVVEHVGDWPRMQAFAREVRRLAPRYFVQTPNFWFPIEPHFLFPFFHWLPEPVRVRLILRTRLGHHGRAETFADAVSAIQSARLLDRRMMATLFPDATIVTERVAMLPKSLMAIRS
jgi:Methyltransferase domain